jgi:hypothetical protein
MLRSISVLGVALLLVGGCERDAANEPVSERGDDVPPCDSSLTAGCEEEDDGEVEDESSSSGGCDGEHEDSGDSSESGDDEGGEADLPYDIEVDVGDTVDLMEAFDEKGVLPTAILDVTMEDGGDWRLEELQSGTPFVVDQADCDHEGNRDTGRDRIFVTWQNPDGSEATDHIDLRYCGA